MVYDFWDYVMSWMIVLAFLIPFGMAILVQMSVTVVSFIALSSKSERKPREKYLTVRVRSYDYDEDN